MSKASVALSNLRAVVIVIVLAFHSALAYLASAPAPTAPFDQAPYIWQAFPIVDPHRWLGLDVICAWFDVTLMSMMFLLSGLFVASSLTRKGARTYVTDRLWRIGVPFLLAMVVLSPLSFYPAYLLRTPAPSVAGFLTQWLSLPSWPIGPQWFLWQLLVVNLLAATLYAAWPGYLARFARLGAWAATHPYKFFALLTACSMVVYVPLAMAFTPWTWSALGPFSIQLCRPGHYIVYFFAGLVLGSQGLDRGLLACDGPLARRWWLWLIAAAVTFGLWAGLTSLTFPDWNKAALAARIGASFAWPLGCASGALLMLAVSLRFAGTVRRRILDTLSANAYSMYLAHYIFVVWLQYALLGSDLFAVGKLLIVLAGALIMSWSVSVAFHRLASDPQVSALKRVLTPVSR
jgi:peptidoglycan/LPS O-acetylase OafA/YrhL